MPLSTAAVEPLASDPAGAEAELRSAYEYFRGVGADHILATVGPMMAAALSPPGAPDRGGRADRGGGADRRPRRPRRAGEVALARATASSAAGERGEAERLAREAVALAERTDSVLLHADSLGGLAEVLIAAGAGGEALEPAACAGELYEAKGDLVSARRWQSTVERLAAAEA